ncbi:MAG TPA: DUF4139 domain-containing protein [Candidatus Acidoferrales bacterium]|nr:DUF4139 domain-containing protein [Candidatus Acidoferrales bacterium]
MQLSTYLTRIAVVGATVAVLGALTCPAAAVPERRTSAAQRQSLTVIVYADFALVRDVRRLNVDHGQNRVVFDDVAPQMDPTTAFLSDLSAGVPIWVHEHNFETAVLSPDAIFARAVGHTVLVIRYDQTPGRETRETAVVLSANGPILRFKDRIETGLPPSSRIAYLSIPSMRRAPGFLFDFESPQAGEHSISLAYLTGGLSWSADYVARLNANDDHLDIDSFITLRNDSGMSFNDASVRVVAGSVQRAAAPEVRSIGRVTVTAAASNVYAVNQSRATRQPVLELYQYTLPQRTTLAIGETKQSLLLFARGVPAREVFEASAGGDFQTQAGAEQRPDVQVSLEFENDGHGLGVPLPTGVIHLYKNDQSGEPVFIGESAIGNIPRKDVVRTGLGPSFEVAVRRVQTDYREIQHLNAPTEYVTAYRVTVKNAKSKSVALRYVEQINGQWHITSESLSHQKLSSDRVSWTIAVPAGGQTVLTFEVNSH